MPNIARSMLYPLTLSLLLGAAVPALAAQNNAIQITHAWSRATPPGATTGAAYFEITNTGTSADTLTAASTPAATTANLHEMKMDGDMMQMRPIAQLAIPAQGHVTFAPHGYHMMLNTLKAPLKEGSHYPLTLHFEHAGAVAVDVVVKAMGAMDMGMGHSH